MAEKHIRRWLSAALRGRGAHVQNIEDGYSVGIPDINICWNANEAWIECKHRPTWPVRPATPVRLKWRPGQSAWLHKRAAVGGTCYLLLGVGEGRGVEVLLFRGTDAEKIEHEPMPQAALRELALAAGKEAVLEHLTATER